MSVSTPTTSEQKAKRGGIPALAAVFLIAAAVAVGGWILWSFWNSLSVSGSGKVVVLDEKPSERAAVEAQDRAQFWQRQRQERQVAQRKAEIEGPDYIRPRPNQPGFVAKGNKTRVIVTKANNGTYRFSAESLEPDFASAEHRQLLGVALRAVTDQTLAKQLNITAEQQKELAAAPRNVSYAIDPAMRKNLETLFAAWANAPENEKAALATPFTNAVRELDATVGPQTKKNIEDWAAKIKKVLNPEQLKGLGG